MDHLFSETIHEYENLAITALLLLPCKMFNPEFIIVPITFIWQIYGYEQGLRYVMAAACGVFICHTLKRRIKRERPPIREMMFKPPFLCKRDKSQAMPSGDST
jgi:hypothetical protein